MRTIRSIHKLAAVLGLGATLSVHAGGTSFSYQGRLVQGTNAASGEFGFRFTLYNAPVVGLAVTDPVTNTVTVDSGVFTTMIDFGPGVFTGEDRWLEIAVRTNGSVAFTTLAPRQAVTPAPSALFSVTAANYSGPVSASQLTGAIPLSLLPAGLLTNNAAGVSLSGVFGGNGGGLANLQAANVVGVVADNNLPVDLAGRDALVSWGAKISKIQNLRSNAANIVWIGDSWSTWGYITGPLRTALQALAGNGGIGYWGMYSYLVERPPAVTYLMTNWGFVAATNTPGMTAATATDTSANLWLTSSVTAFDVCYVTCAGGGTFTASVDGGAAITVPTAAASSGVGWANVASGLGFPPHSHRLQLQVLSLGTGGVTVGGVNCYVEGAPSIRLHDLGWSGSSTADWQAGSVLPGWTNGLTWLVPDMAVIMLGVNDKIESITPTQVRINLAGLIAQLRSVNPAISILLVAPSDTGITNPAYTSFQYRDAMKAYASSNGCGFVDGCAALGSYPLATNLGLMANYSHVNRDGGLLLANAVYRYLQPASLELAPAAMTIGNLVVGGTISGNLAGGTNLPNSIVASGTATLQGGTSLVATAWAHVTNRFLLGFRSLDGNLSTLAMANITNGVSFTIKTGNAADNTNQVDWAIVKP